MLAFLRRYEVFVFLASIVAANFLFVYCIAHEFLPRGMYNYGRFLLLAGVLFALVFISRGFGAVVDVLKPMLEWRRDPAMYAFALLIVPTIVLAFLATEGLMTGAGLSLISATPGVLSNPGILFTIMFGAFVGEVVWVSYCLRQLRHLVSDYLAGMIVGIVWGFWWFPMVIYDIGVVPGLTFSTLIFSQGSVGILCAFVYAKSRSGLLVFIMQFMVNAALLVFPIAPTTGGVETFQQYVVFYFAVATVLFLTLGPRPLVALRRA